MEEQSHRLFEFTPKHNSANGRSCLQLAPVKGSKVDWTGDSQKLQDTQQRHIGLISKVWREDRNNVVFVVGGLSAPGTKRIGECFSEWLELMRARDVQLKTSVERRPFAISFKLGQHYRNISEVRVLNGSD